ncbi:MAG: hypothetical protein KA169_20795, partial [Burkholderiaceae bacterium]|nr:hypothetical protein [Burkholderiaceae bacterium]
SDHTVSIQLYRMAQEAVNNALKHAPGARIVIALRHEAGGLRLTVGNDSVRPTVGSPDGSEAGMGLRILTHRARLIGASLAVQHEADRWTVTVHVSGARALPSRVRDA